MPDQPVANLGALSDLCTPWCVHVVATLRIADHIAAGKVRIHDLAAAAGCDPHVLHRVLTHLVSKGLFEEPGPGTFLLNEPARKLLEPSQLIGLDLEGIGGRMAHAWGTLLPYVRTGKSAYHERFGRPFWEDLDAHPEVAATFDALLGSVGHGSPNPDFSITGGWESVRSVVNVGGGTGAMLAEILRKWPHIDGTLVELPRTVAPLRRDLPGGRRVRSRHDGRAELLRHPTGRRGPLFAEEGRQQLARSRGDGDPGPLCRRGSPRRSSGHPRRRWRRRAPRGLSIEMVLLGGKNRTVAEFREIASRAGLEIIAAGPQPSGHFVVECRPT